ncbi:thioredoxin family protein [Rosistilla oblonga]|uniref:thioredoxin family protein n=1 Tax=Rosistilla oblonga TaxID=2527990 RepID=UPI003A970EEC
MRIALLLTALFVFASSSQAEIPWNADLKVAHQQAQAEGKLLLVHFESDNCVWCDRLEAGAFQSPEVAAVIGQAFVPVKINASNNKKLAEYFKVNRFPTDVVVDASGAVHAHSVSPQAPLQYVTMLQEAAAKGGRPIGAPAANPAANIAQQTPATPSPTSLQTPAVAAQPPAAEPTGPASGYGMPPSIAGNVAANAPQGQFQLPSHSGLQTPSVTPASAAISMPPSKPVQQNDGGAASIEANSFAATTATQEPAAPSPEPESPSVAATPPLAMDGFCPVAILDETRWVSGDKQFGAIHLGKLYLFASAEAQTKFLADPEKYTPALGGMDVVRFFENQEQVEGTREFGLHHQGQLFFFTSEDSLKRFFQSPESYSVKAQGVMHQAMSQVRQLH